MSQIIAKKEYRSNDVYFGLRTVIFFLRDVFFHFDHYLSRRSNSLNVIQTKVGFWHSRRILLCLFWWLLIMQSKGQALGRNGNYASARTYSNSGVFWHKGICSISDRKKGCDGNDDVLQVGKCHGECWIVNPKIGTKWSIKFSVVLFFFPNDSVSSWRQSKTIFWRITIEVCDWSMLSKIHQHGSEFKRIQFVRSIFEFKSNDRSTCKLAPHHSFKYVFELEFFGIHLFESNQSNFGTRMEFQRMQKSDSSSPDSWANSDIKLREENAKHKKRFSFGGSRNRLKLMSLPIRRE